MSWLKDSILDILFLGIIVSTFFYDSNTTYIIIWAYTGLLLISKLLALFVPFLRKRTKSTTTPDIVYHIIYIASFGILFFIEKWYLAICWVIIWALSVILVSMQKKEKESN